MRRNTILLLFVATLIISLRTSDISPSEMGKNRVWVFFTDKGTSCEGDSGSAWGEAPIPLSEMAQRASRLPPRTRSRRLRAQGSAMDVLDFPVFQPYIDEVLQIVRQAYSPVGTTSRVTASRWLNGITVEAPDSIIPRILKLPYVRSVEPVATYGRRKAQDARHKTRDSRLRTGNEKELATEFHRKTRKNSAKEDAQQSRPYHAPGIQHPEYGVSAAQIQQIHADVLHEKGYHGEGIIIALLDTGFDLSHEALRNVRVLAQYDFVNGDDETLDNPPVDDIGQDDHGTEVLSIIAGNSPGNLMGVAYAAEYLLAKTEKISHEGVFFESEIEEDWWVAGLEWAELNGADVVNSSLGYSDWYSYSDMDGATAKTTLAANIAVQKGVTVVVSAGNEGKSRDWPYISAPADGQGVIAVGAVDYRGELASFSSIGPTYDGRIKPDMVAMGDDTYVVDPNNTNDYRKADGTSMATPLVAGTAALLLQALPGLDRSGDLIKLLKYTATRAQYPDNRYGWGIANAEAALRYGSSPRFMEELDNWDPTSAVLGPQRTIVYPNPVRRNSGMGRLNIHSSESMESIRLYSISGLLIYERRDMGSAKFCIWDLKNQHGQEVASGIYICLIRLHTGAVDIRKVAVVE